MMLLLLGQVGDNGPELTVAAASFMIAVVALIAAIWQVTMQVNAEARRKGKTDSLAIGAWSIEFAQAKLLVHLTLHIFRLKSPWGDPRVLTVPFITVGTMEEYLRGEAEATGRSSITRRLQHRLIESTTKAIAMGSGKYTGRMYKVRETTSKTCEACWADAMNMCGMT